MNQKEKDYSCCYCCLLLFCDEGLRGTGCDSTHRHLHLLNVKVPPIVCLFGGVNAVGTPDDIDDVDSNLAAVLWWCEHDEQQDDVDDDGDDDLQQFLVLHAAEFDGGVDNTMMPVQP